MRRYCNKNNTFPNAGYREPLKISFNFSPVCFFFFTLLWTQNTQTNKRNTPCCLSSLLFALGQHSSWKLTPKNRNPERFSSFALNELMQERFEQLMTAAIIFTVKMEDFSQTASASWIQTLHFHFEIVIALGLFFSLKILGKISFFFVCLICSISSPVGR